MGTPSWNSISKYCTVGCEVSLRTYPQSSVSCASSANPSIAQTSPPGGFRSNALMHFFCLTLLLIPATLGADTLVSQGISVLNPAAGTPCAFNFGSGFPFGPLAGLALASTCAPQPAPRLRATGSVHCLLLVWQGVVNTMRLPYTGCAYVLLHLQQSWGPRPIAYRPSGLNEVQVQHARCTLQHHTCLECG